MGPTCEITLASDLTAESLTVIDRYLRKAPEEVVTTRKGLNWDIRVSGRPVTVVADARSQISLAAACTSPEDYDVLRRIGDDLAGKPGKTHERIAHASPGGLSSMHHTAASNVTHSS